MKRVIGLIVVVLLGIFALPVTAQEASPPAGGPPDSFRGDHRTASSLLLVLSPTRSYSLRARRIHPSIVSTSSRVSRIRFNRVQPWKLRTWNQGA